jgi:ABC-type phosphate/phosphonate transport system substrate-binding protein
MVSRRAVGGRWAALRQVQGPGDAVSATRRLGRGAPPCNGRRAEGNPRYRLGVGIAAVVLLAAVACMAGCGGRREEATIGTRGRPLELAVPAPDKHTTLAHYVRRHTKLRCRELAAASPAELLALLDEDKLDVMVLSAPMYALVSEPYSLLAILKAQRAGTFETRGMILVRADRGLVTVADAKGLVVAATDPASASGCLLERVLMTEEGAAPSKVIYLNDEARVVRAVYYKEADLGFVTWRLDAEGRPDDARAALAAEVPDIFEAVVPLAVTHAVPNEAVAVRARVPDTVRADVAAALIKFARTHEGAAYLGARLGIEGFALGDDVEYAELRQRLQAAGVHLADFLPKAE